MNNCVTYFDIISPFYESLYKVLFPWLVLVISISAVLYFFYQYKNEDKNIIDGWLIFGFVALGAMLGITAGASKAPVIGTFLPAFLTFVSGLLAYLLSKDSHSQWKRVIPFCMAGMMMASVLNVFIGTALKEQYINYERDYEVWLIEKKNQLDIEKAGRLKRLNAGEEIIFIEIQKTECE